MSVTLVAAAAVADPAVDFVWLLVSRDQLPAPTVAFVEVTGSCRSRFADPGLPLTVAELGSAGRC